MVRLIRIGPSNTEHQNDTISHCSVGILIKNNCFIEKVTYSNTKGVFLNVTHYQQ